MRDEIVGRGAERAALERPLAQLVDDGAAIRIVLAAEPGFGKTTLVTDLCTRATDRGVLAIEARASSMGGTLLPFGPVTTALGRHLDTLDEHERTSLLDGLPSIDRLLDPTDPMSSSVGDGPEVATDVERVRAFHSIGLLLARIARRGPVLLALDDLHWADAATVGLISHLRTDLASVPVGLVVTVRPGDLDQRPDVRRVLGELLRDRHATHVELGPLDEDAIVELTEPILGGRPGPVLTREIRSRSGGVPLAVEALAADLLSGGRLTTGDDGIAADMRGMTMPDYVVDLFSDRIGALDALGRSTLLAIATSHRPATVDEATKVLGAAGCPSISNDSVTDAVSGLERALLVRTAAAPAGQVVEVVHPLVAEAAIDVATTPERRAVHAGWATVLTEQGANPHEVAVHVIDAGDAVDGERAVEILELAGRAALGAGASDTATRCLGEAAARARTSTGTTHERLGEILELQSSAWSDLGEPAVAAACLREAARELAPIDPVRASTASFRAADMSWLQGDFDAVDPLIEQAARLVEGAGPAERLAVVAQRCAIAARRGDRGDLRRRVAELEAVASTLTTDGSPTDGPTTDGPPTDDTPINDTALWVSVVRFNAAALLALLDPAPLTEVLDRLPIGWRSVGSDARRTAMGLALESNTMLGRWSDVEELITTVPSTVPGDLAIRAWRRDAAEFNMAFCRGEWDRASDLLAETVPLHFDRAVCRQHLSAALLAVHRGEVDSAREAISRARQHAGDDVESESHLALATALDVIVAEVEGSPVDAAAQEDGWASGHVAMASPIVLSSRASWLIASGRSDEALGISASLRRWAPDGGRVGVSAVRIDALAIASEDPAGARTMLLDAAEQFDRLSMPFEAARCRVEACEALPKADDAAFLGPVAAELDRIGAEPWRRRAQAIVGVRTPVSRPLLTPREQEVAACVAEGLSNAEIAERLFISIRTVTSHLDHTYTKLGIGSRSALTAYVLRGGDVTHPDR